MAYSQRAFGLSIATDGPIPGLLSGVATATNDLEIEVVPDEAAWNPHAADVPRFEFPPDEAGCTLRVWSDRDDRVFRFLFSDESDFIVDRDGKRIRARWRSDVGLEGMSVYLLGPVMGFALRLRGMTCLHASAVCPGDSALAIIAGAGHGKSTLAAAFALRGVPVLTDDLLALRQDDGLFWAQPSYPRIRLWPHAVKGLFGSPDALPRITPDDPDWDKCFIDLAEEPFEFCGSEVPLAALYVGVQDETTRRPVLEEVTGHEALLTVLSNTYSRRMPGRQTRAADFDSVASLLRGVPVRRFRMREGFEHLDELCDLLLEDCGARACTGV